MNLILFISLIRARILNERASRNVHLNNGKDTNKLTAKQLNIPKGIDAEQLIIRDIDKKFESILDDLECITLNFINEQVELSFNWDVISSKLSLNEAGQWYIVVFRSIRNENANTEELYTADVLAYEEAKQSGGLLKYWYAVVNKNHECLAMCIWANREWAKLAHYKPSHIKAMQLASKMYHSYILERYHLTKLEGSKELTFEKL